MYSLRVPELDLGLAISFCLKFNTHDFTTRFPDSLEGVLLGPLLSDCVVPADPVPETVHSIDAVCSDPELLSVMLGCVSFVQLVPFRYG